MAGSLLPVSTAALGYVSHDIVPFGELYPAVVGVGSSFLFYAAAGRDCRKDDVHHLENPPQRACGRTGKPDIFTGIAGLERDSYGNRRLCLLVPDLLVGKPQVV